MPPAKTPVDAIQEPATPNVLLSVEDLVAAVKAAQPPVVEAPPLNVEVIAAALGMTVAELDTMRQAAIKRQQANEATVDEPLDAPIRFWCDRYKSLRFVVNRKRRKFVNGQFLAQTKNEAEAVRKLTNADFIFEGDDLKKPIRCRVCRAEFYNSEVFQDHMSRHVLA